MEVDVLFLSQLDYSIMSSDNLDASETSFGKLYRRREVHVFHGVWVENSKLKFFMCLGERLGSVVLRQSRKTVLD